MTRPLAVLVLALLAANPAWARSLVEPPSSEAVCCVAFLPNSRSFVYATVGGQVGVSGLDGRILHEARGSIVALALSPDGRMVACCLYESVVIVEIKSGRAVVTQRHGANAVAFSPDGKHLATAGRLGLYLWDAATGKEVWKNEEPADCVAFAPDGSKLAAAVEHGIRLHEPVRGKLLREIDWGWRTTVGFKGSRFTGFTRGLTFSAGGRRIALTESGATREGGSKLCTEFLEDTYSGSAHKAEAKVWEVATGREVFSIAGKSDEAYGPLFNHSGRLVAFADKTDIAVWDMTRHECVERFTGRESWISGLAMSDDGRLLASAGADGVKLWELPQEQPFGQEDAAVLVNHLSSRNAKVATRSVFALAANPTKSVPLLRERLRPARSVPDERVAALLAELDSDHFAVRQRAAELEKLERLAGPALEKLLASKPPLEVRRRTENLLDQLEEPNLSAEILRGLRAVEVLERVNTPDSRKLLEELAQGEPDVRLTQEAKAALARTTRK